MDHIDEIFKLALEEALKELNVTGLWQPSTVTLQKRFLTDIAAVICCNKALEGIVALSIPLGVAHKIACSDNPNATSTDAIKLVDKLARAMMNRSRNSSGVAVLMKGIVTSTDLQKPAPTPRRVIPFTTEKGNLALEVYLRKPSFFVKEKLEWWNANLEGNGAPLI
jgi:hypothetical protein